MSVALPPLESERLVLSLAGREDYLQLCDLVADPHVQRFLGPPAEDPQADMFGRVLRGAGSWQLYGYGMFMLREKASGAFVGQAGIFHTLRGFGKGFDDVPEAAWMLARSHWGKGYASEAMAAALHWFDKAHGHGRIVCMIEPENIASIRLATRIGFAHYDDHILTDGAVVGLYQRLAPA